MESLQWQFNEIEMEYNYKLKQKGRYEKCQLNIISYLGLVDWICLDSYSNEIQRQS